MKSRIISMLAVFGFLATIGTNASASVLSDIKSSLSQILEKGPSYFCRKGSAFSFTFSVRSGSGLACKSKLVAGLAEHFCAASDIESYNTSKCHGYAVEALKDETISPKDVAMREAKNMGGQVYDMVKKAL